MKLLSDFSSTLIGMVITFEAEKDGKKMGRTADCVTSLTLRWEGGTWKPFEIWTDNWPEGFGNPIIKPEWILEEIITATIDIANPEVPEKPKFQVGQRIIYEHKENDHRVGTISEVELDVDQKGGYAERYGLKGKEKMELLGVDEIKELLR